MNKTNRSGRPTRWAAVAALAVAAVAGTPLAALAASDEPDRVLELSPEGRDVVVPVVFDGVVPGDSGEFTVDIRNAGPTSGYLVVDMLTPSLSEPATPQFLSELVVGGPDFRGLGGPDLRAGIQVGDLRSPSTLLLGPHRLEPGEQVSVPLWFDFPFEATGGNRALEGEHVVDIDLRAQIMGEDGAPDPGPGEPTAPDGTPGDNVPAPGDAPGDGVQSPQEGATSLHGAKTETGGAAWLPRTGADLGLLALAAAITGLGITLWALVTRRKEQEEEQ